jgi:nudix-type nucleoside diphosphatase (YffH/AdpP family)
MTKDQDDSVAIVGTREAYTGWTKLLVATARLPDGRTIEREIEHHGDGICVLPYHPQRKTAVLVRQPRIAVQFSANVQHTLEAIAGIIEHDDPEACVGREAMEEARLKLDTLEHLFTAWTMPGLSTERLHFYLGTYSGAARPEIKAGLASEGETTVAVEIGLAALARMVDDNALPDAKTLVLVQTLRLRKPDLF